MTLMSTSERPERSRNAKAQARHRAKRKAYIESLEQTVTKLQTALGCTPDDLAALPPPLVKIRELEQENARLMKENDDLRRMLADGRTLPRAPYCDARDYKRRKMSDDIYLPEPDLLPRPPPPLTIPQPLNSHYSGSGHSSLFNLHPPAPPFQLPNTPSGSSSTSSPPFSASIPFSRSPSRELYDPSNHIYSLPKCNLHVTIVIILSRWKKTTMSVLTGLLFRSLISHPALKQSK